MHDVLHIQTLCNSANCSKTVRCVRSCTDVTQTISNNFSLKLHLVVVKLCSKSPDCSTRTNLRLTIHLSCIASSRFPTFPDSSPDSVSFEHLTLDLWRSAVPDSIGPARSQQYSTLEVSQHCNCRDFQRSWSVITFGADHVATIEAPHLYTVNTCCLLGLDHPASHGSDCS